jgi:hypothetical protein
MSLTDLQKKAKKLGVDYDEFETEEKLQELVNAAEAKKEQEKEENAIKLAEIKKQEALAKKSNIILQDTDGNDVEQKDYFYHGIDKDTGKIILDTAPSYFNKICGKPVDREELIEVFNSIFDKSKKFLFYKLVDKEVYLVIVPLKYAKTVGKANESIAGDHQKHALSFITEGSVNVDSLKSKLTRIAEHASSISKEPRNVA